MACAEAAPPGTRRRYRSTEMLESDENQYARSSDAPGESFYTHDAKYQPGKMQQFYYHKRRLTIAVPNISCLSLLDDQAMAIRYSLFVAIGRRAAIYRRRHINDERQYLAMFSVLDFKAAGEMRVCLVAAIRGGDGGEYISFH